MDITSDFTCLQTLQCKVEDSNQEVMELKRKIQSYVADAFRVQCLLVAKVIVPLHVAIF